MRTITKVLAVLMLMVLGAGCAGMSSSQQRMLSGGAIGAGTGAAIGVVTGGSAVSGAVVGGAVGVVGGAVVDHIENER